MRVLLTFIPLFLSVMLLQLSSGAIGPLDVLSGSKLEFSKPEIGLLGSAHFLGFFVGCWWALRIMGAVGHARSFAVFAACGATVLIGGAIAQFPVGWLADRFDRRWVLIGLSALSVVVCGGVVMTGSGDFYTIYIGAALFGIATFPIFSVASAHANDFTDPAKSVEVNASLMFIYGIGAIFAPYVTSTLIDFYGPSALFAFIALAHLILVVFSLTRMLARPTLTERTRYTYLPRTSFTIFKLLRRSKRRGSQDIQR